MTPTSPDDEHCVSYAFESPPPRNEATDVLIPALADRACHNCKNEAMTDPAPEVNQRKIRLGLALLTAVFVGAVVLFFVTNDTLGKAVFFGVGVVLLVRMFLLVRWLRSQNPK